MTAGAKLYADPAVLWKRVLPRLDVRPNGCWLWTGALNSQGYGCTGSGRSHRTVLVHRLSVIVRDGSIPDGMVADHTCHKPRICRGGPTCVHRRCANPEHLEVVTHAENNRRGAQQARTTCKAKHPLSVRMRAGKPVRFCPICEYAAKKARRMAGASS